MEFILTQIRQSDLYHTGSGFALLPNLDSQTDPDLNQDLDLESELDPD
jgi:hypothetical protein